MTPTKTVRTARLVLVPLAVTHAVDMAGVLSDPALYVFTGGNPPPALTDLEEQYRFQAAGSPREGEVWHNWIIHLDDAAIELVQATVRGETADLAWVVGASWQGAGYATEASLAMRNWLASQGSTLFTAHRHLDHAASAAIAASLALHPTGTLDDDGEMIWASGPGRGGESPVDRVEPPTES